MPTNFPELVGIFIDLIDSLIPIVSGLALLAFIWGLVMFISKSGDEKSHEEGKNLMKWGLVALFVMLSYSAIIAFVQGDFGFTSNLGSRLPQ